VIVRARIRRLTIDRRLGAAGDEVQATIRRELAGLFAKQVAPAALIRERLRRALATDVKPAAPR
jgi:hypothetical protein